MRVSPNAMGASQQLAPRIVNGEARAVKKYPAGWFLDLL
jgi:hypothetical protein